MARWRGTSIRLLTAAALVVALGVSPAAHAADRPRYDVPHGFARCPEAQAWGGFFKWASVHRTTCRAASRFMRTYAERAARGDMPRSVRGYRCRLRFWRNRDGDVYASRHACRCGRVAIRFYGMV